MKITIAEIIEYFKQDFVCADSWQFMPKKTREAAELLTELESAGRALLEWHVDWHRSYHQWARPEREVRELTALIERFRALLEPTEPDEERWKHPPCMECGAMTAKEAETKCRCGGDKDSCHGSELWPEG